MVNPSATPEAALTTGSSASGVGPKRDKSGLIERGRWKKRYITPTSGETGTRP